MTKYFAIAIFSILLMKKHLTLTSAGKKIIPLLLVISVSMLFITSLWFNAADKDTIVRQRVLWHDVKS